MPITPYFSFCIMASFIVTNCSTSYTANLSLSLRYTLYTLYVILFSNINNFTSLVNSSQVSLRDQEELWQFNFDTSLTAADSETALSVTLSVLLCLPDQFEILPLIYTISGLQSALPLDKVDYRTLYLRQGFTGK